jgi:hypothetical protein
VALDVGHKQCLVLFVIKTTEVFFFWRGGVGDGEGAF